MQTVRVHYKFDRSQIDLIITLFVYIYELFRVDHLFGFDCEFDECPEAVEEPKPDCRNQYTLDSCCAVKTICGQDEVKKLHTCWNEGRDYHGGNLIYPKSEPCYKCLCDENFDNSTAIEKNKNCKPVDCGIEIHAILNYQEGCAGVYFNDNYCCPVEFRCRMLYKIAFFCNHQNLIRLFSPFNFIQTIIIAQEGDTILEGRGKSAAESKPQQTCKYGPLTLGYKQAIKTDDKCLECSCEYPPLVHCTRTITTEECH